MNYALGGSIIALIGTIAVAVIAAWQARRGSRDSPYDKLAARVVHLEGQVDDLRLVAENARDESRQSRNAAEQAVAENAVMVDHHFDVVRSVATLNRPWPAIPHALRHRLAANDYPAVPIVTQHHPQDEE